MEIRAERVIYKDTIDLLIFSKEVDGGYSYVSEMTVQKLQPGMFIPKPSLELSNHEAQKLMDELWHCGLRPSEGSGSAGSLAATERHLKDMQQIAFGLLKKHNVSKEAHA